MDILRRLLTIVLLAPGLLFAQESLTIYSYHNHPPFVTGDQEGLTFDLAKELNARTGNQYDIKVEIIPRSRINLMLSEWLAGNCPGPGCDEQWIIPWVNPKWGFGKSPQEVFHWVRQMRDANVIVSMKDEPVDYSAPNSLSGLRFGGMRGHHYVGIDDLIKTGAVTRIDGDNERNNLLKLVLGRIDATLLPRSTVDYYFQKDEILMPRKNDFYVANKEHQSYWRHMMFSRGRTDLLAILED